MIGYKGRRIRPNNKKLFFDFWLLCISAIFILTLFCFYFIKIIKYDWSCFALKNLPDMVKSIDFGFLIIAVSIGIILNIVFFVIMFKFGREYLTKLRHRQALCRMILENGWYETEPYQDGFFADFFKCKSKDRIVWFPKMYYKLKDNRIYIKVQVTMGKSQEQMLSLEKKIQTGLFCEFIEFKANEPYYDYVFYYNIKDTRINISDVEVVNGSIEFMQGFKWVYDKLPHALIVGGTGSGKTYFLLILIKALVSSGAVLHILDPKNADLADLSAVMPNVFYQKEDIIATVQGFCDDMLQRSEDMKQMENYKTGNNYADVGLKPHFLIFDEYVAFFEMLSSRELNDVFSNMKQIAMLGRQAGYFIILACQRADAKYLGDGLRDQFHFRVALGRNSELGYKMVFGENDKKFMTMPAGRGYVDMGTNVISEFYVPYVPAGYDFMKEIGKSVINHGEKYNNCDDEMYEELEYFDVEDKGDFNYDNY